MTYTVTELIGDRSLTIDGSGRKYSRAVEIHPCSGQLEAVSNTGFFIGDYYQTDTESDDAAFLESMNATPSSADGQTWKVSLSYSTRSAPANPLAAAYKTRWVIAPRGEEILERDITGAPIVASNWLPYTDPVTKEVSRPTLSITRNVAIQNPVIAVAYSNAVNADPFMGGTPGQVRCTSISYSEPIEYDLGVYYTLSMEFQFAPYWDKYILDRGTAELVSGKLKPILIGGQPTSEPQMLNGSGQKSNTPFYKRYQVYQRLPFRFLLT